MQKLAVILMFLLTLGGLTQPTGDLTALNLHEMYRHCAAEDPDINPADFVFEHLLNLEDIIDFIEGEHDAEPGEQPHQPYQLVQSVSQMAVTMPRPVSFEVSAPVFFVEKNIYPICKEHFYRSNYIEDIFHPPAV